MDFRLLEELDRFVAERDLVHNWDDVSWAGAGWELVHGKRAVRKFILKQIALSRDLHKAEVVIIFHHSDCGAYKSAYNFASEEAGKRFQLEDMKKAEEIIRERFPEMEVKKIWGQLLDPEGRKVEFSEVD